MMLATWYYYKNQTYNVSFPFLTSSISIPITVGTGNLMELLTFSCNVRVLPKDVHSAQYWHALASSYSNTHSIQSSSTMPTV